MNDVTRKEFTVSFVIITVAAGRMTISTSAVSMSVPARAVAVMTVSMAHVTVPSLAVSS